MPITAPIPEVRKAMEDALATVRRVPKVSLAHVPEHEWRTLVATDGPFTETDWRRMPALYKELTDCGGVRK